MYLECCELIQLFSVMLPELQIAESVTRFADSVTAFKASTKLIDALGRSFKFL